LFDEAPDHGRIIVSAQLAAIHDEVKAMPMGYETLVWDMGSALSGGRRPASCLPARFIANPSYCFSMKVPRTSIQPPK